MPRASTTRRFLRRLCFADVKFINNHYRMQPRKSKDELISQIVSKVGPGLGVLVSRGGPLSLARWNEILSETDGTPRKSFATAIVEIENNLDPVYDDFDGDESIAEIRKDGGRMRTLARRIGIAPADLTALVQPIHGRTLLSTFITTLRKESEKTKPQKPQNPRLPSVARVASTRVKADSVEVLDPAWLKNHSIGAESISIAAGYYEAAFIESLLAQNYTATRVRLLFNGLGGQRLDDQVQELRALCSKLEKESRRSVEIKLAFAPGLFHSKLFLFTKGSATTAVIGSANATSAAFNKNRNEEILISLPDTGALAGYFDAAWNSARNLDSLDLSAKSMISFFRSGSLYFKPASSLSTTINPFRELIKTLSKEERELLGVVSFPHAEQETGIGPFNLKLAVQGPVPTGRDPSIADDIGEPELANTIKASIKPWSVETCYGYWVPSAVNAALNSQLDKAGAHRDKKLLAFMTALNAMPDADLHKKYREYLDAVRKELQRIPDCISRVRDNPYDEAVFPKFIARVKRHLEDDDRRRRLTHPFISGKIPEFWDDASAYEDFYESFFEYLSQVAQGGLGQKVPRVPGLILRKIKITDTPDAETLHERFETHLEKNGWEKKDWKQ